MSLRRSAALRTVAWALLIMSFSIATVLAAEPTKVKVGYYPALVDIPVFIAESQGIFTKNGLDVEMISFTTGPALIGSLLSASTPFIDGGGALLSFPQVSRGHKIRGVANFWAQNLYTLIVRSDVPTPHMGQPYPAPVRDLKGKRIGVVALGSTTSAMAESLIRDAGLRVGEDVTLLPVGAPATAIAALVAGNIDGYISFPPVNQILDATHPGSYKVLVGASQYPPLLKINFFNHIATTQEFIDAQPSTVLAMCKSIREALEWLKDPAHKTDAVKGLEKWLPGNPPGVIAAALDASMPLLMTSDDKLGRIQREAVQNGNDQLLGLGYIKEGVSYDTYAYKPCN